MSDVRDRLQQLLDGELEPSEIADDAAETITTVKDAIGFIESQNS